MFKNINSLHLKVYFRKYWRIFINSHGYLKLLSTAIIMTLVIFATSESSFIKYNETRTMGFAIVCACIWTGLFNSIELISSERRAIKHDHRSGNVDFSVFLLAHMLVELILCALEALIVATIIVIVHKSKLEIKESLDLYRIIAMYIGNLLVIYASDVLGLLISTIVKSTKTAMTIMPFALIFQLVYSDFIFKLEGAVKFLSNLTIAKWGLDILGIAIDFNTMSTGLTESQKEGRGYKEIEIINRFLDIERQDNLGNYKPTIIHVLGIFLILIVFIFVCFVLAWFAMELIDKDER